MADRFKGKVVIVTGSASGIGEATARRFVAEGAKVVLVDRNKDTLEKVAKSLPADQVMACAVDVSESRAVDGMVTISRSDSQPSMVSSQRKKVSLALSGDQSGLSAIHDPSVGVLAARPLPSAFIT